MVTTTHKQSNAAFRAIADPTRREILSLLRGGARTVGEITVNFRTSRPAISKHLRVLRQARLVRERREGRLRRYELTPAPLAEADRWIEGYRSFWALNLQSLKRHLEGGER